MNKIAIIGGGNLGTSLAEGLIKSGKYFVDDETLNNLERKNQIVFKYDQVVNGSSNQIAGVCNEDGNIVGMMPHPERAVESEINPKDNKPSTLIFKSLLKKMGVEN